MTSTGDVLVTGGFSGAVNFGGGLLTSAGLDDLFIVKLDGATGNHLWNKRFGDEDVQPGMVLAIDGADNILVTGGFTGAVDFGGGPLIAGPDGALFIAKLDASGDVLWAKSFDNAIAGPGPSLKLCSGIAADSDHIIVTGCFHDAVDFGGGPLVSAGETDSLIAKFDAAGAHIWAKRFGDPNHQKNLGMAVDSGGNVLVTGSFMGTVDLGGGPLVASSDEFSLYAAKLDASGAHIWSKRVGEAAKP